LGYGAATDADPSSRARRLRRRCPRKRGSPERCHQPTCALRLGTVADLGAQTPASESANCDLSPPASTDLKTSSYAGMSARLEGL
jgi:hypothetical protein